MIWNSDDTPVIRTDFGDDAAWARLRQAIVEPQTADRFQACVSFVDDRNFEGLPASRLVDLGEFAACTGADGVFRGFPG